MFHCWDVPRQPKASRDPKRCRHPVRLSLIAAKSGSDETHRSATPVATRPRIAAVAQMCGEFTGTLEKSGSVGLKNHSVRLPSSSDGSIHSIGMNSSRPTRPVIDHSSAALDMGLRQWAFARRGAMATIGAACAVVSMNANVAA